MLPELVLVEDSPDDELLSLRAIARCGVMCKVTVRRDGAEALEHLLGAGCPPALIVLDYQLPRYSGREILEKLRASERARFIPIVIFSGTNRGEALTDCYRAGANSCVVKPNDVKEYVSKLTSVAHYWLTVNQPSCTEIMASDAARASENAIGP